MKKGIVELSDLILVNKSDGQLEIPARMAQMEYISALKFVQSRTPNWKADVLRVSSAEKNGIDDAWKNMKQYYSQLISSNNLYQRRGLQQRRWMWKIIEQEIMLRLQSDSKVKTLVQSLENEVTEGVVTSGHAAEVILDAFLRQDVLKGQ
ncbi:ArgK protein-domain-containing protein [Zopfochytrium polystomum]|nr:ArgK protein-domain-containing protein [Zopfochytrium polystomum]